MKKNLLISGLGGSLFPYLIHKLESNYNLFFIDSNPNLVNLYPSLNLTISPKAIETKYIDFLKEIILKNKIDCFIPLVDEEILKANELKNYFSNLEIILPNYEFSKMCLIKPDLMRQLSLNSISIIKTQTIDDFKLNPFFPAIIKPISGRGSRGIQKITNIEQVDSYLNLNLVDKNELFVQEYIEGTEYTIGVLESKKSELIYIGTRKIIEKKGITIIAQNEFRKDINQLVEKISKSFKPSGPYNVQLISNEKGLFVFEINPRFSTTMIMSYESGIDEITYYLNQNNNSKTLPIFPTEGLILHRNWQNNFYNG